ncbi:hypothetical protein BN1708_017965, partial [Verticillium longisporum]
PHAADS